MKNKVFLIFLALLFLSSALLAGTKLEFLDPKGDDKGPGNYVYPTDPIYVAGSFDLLKAEIEDKGEAIDFKITFNAPVTFQWGDYWDVQQIQIYLDLDHVKDSGHTATIPGTQVLVDPADAWEKVVFIDPHTVPKINGEIELKAADMKDDIVLPTKIKPIGKSLKATVKKADLGVADDADISTWGYGILMLSATGFPGDWCVLMRRVNEYEGQHRFGNGSDGAGDPNVIDMFVDNADGSDDEADIQYDMLNDWESGMDPEDTSADKLTVIKLVYPK
ncbi:MAG TPA: glucodextranase DOMON-like domain-containing protein [Candidatus Cloacimonadota bacterium]|nr:glucodextranase DOMON-like domain-containing protein [Candidatus Cloacimonadota bacterium]